MNKKQKDILKFFESMAQGGNFRQQALFSLAELCNLEHSTFFLIDPGGNLFDPVTLNVESGIADNYVEHFQDKDIFHPQNLPSKQYVYSPVMHITDVMSMKEFEQTEYYNDFLRVQGFYHETIISLTEKGKLIGGIGLYKPQNEEFKPETKDQLKLITRFLEGQLSQHLALQRALADQQMYQRCMDENPTGIILFDRNFSILFSNKAAGEMVAALLHKSINLDQFIKHAVSLTGTLTSPDRVSTLTLYSPSLKEFTIRIKPVDNRLFPGRQTFLMELMPGDSSLQGSPGPDRAVIENVRDTYDLSDRELQVLGLVMQGLSNIETAERLFISPNTVKAHLRNILRKTGTRNRMMLYRKIRGCT